MIARRIYVVLLLVFVTIGCTTHPSTSEIQAYETRVQDYPSTYIQIVRVDLTSPNHWVTLEWAGPLAAKQETGPFRSCPGLGLGNNDCNEKIESNRPGSNCTPKGHHVIEGFNKKLPSAPEARYVSWIDQSRAVAIHSSSKVRNYPDSAGCVRMASHPAQLIYDNSIVRKTVVEIGGRWTSVKLDDGEP